MIKINLLITILFISCNQDVYTRNDLIDDLKKIISSQDEKILFQKIHKNFDYSVRLYDSNRKLIASKNQKVVYLHLIGSSGKPIIHKLIDPDNVNLLILERKPVGRAL